MYITKISCNGKMIKVWDVNTFKQKSQNILMQKQIKVWNKIVFYTTFENAWLKVKSKIWLKTETCMLSKMEFFKTCLLNKNVYRLILNDELRKLFKSYEINTRNRIFRNCIKKLLFKKINVEANLAV